MGGGAGPLLPLPVERHRWSRAAHTHPVVQPERRKRSTLRLQAHVRVHRGANRGGVRGGEVNREEGEIPHSHVSQRAGLCSEEEATLPHIQSLQRWRCPEFPTVPFTEPGTEPAHQKHLTLSLSLNVFDILLLTF